MARLLSNVSTPFCLLRSLLPSRLRLHLRSHLFCAAGAVFLAASSTACVHAQNLKDGEKDDVPESTLPAETNSSVREEIPVSSEVRSLSPERTYGPDECVSYFQPRKKAAYMCELPDGSSRPLRSGETRSVTLTKEEIETVLRDNFDDVVACEQILTKGAQKDAGKLWMRFEIDPNGEVIEVEPDTKRTTYKNAAIIGCVQKKIEEWKFPISKNDESVEVTYPFEFPTPAK